MLPVINGAPGSHGHVADGGRAPGGGKAARRSLFRRVPLHLAGKNTLPYTSITFPRLATVRLPAPACMIVAAIVTVQSR
jgi:hypothetical protein